MRGLRSSPPEPDDEDFDALTDCRPADTTQPVPCVEVFFRSRTKVRGRDRHGYTETRHYTATAPGNRRGGDGVCAAVLADGATLARRNDPDRRPVPKQTFKKRLPLNMGGQKLELIYPGPNHEPGNIFIWAPQQKTLMWVDVVFPGWVPFKSLALAQDVPGYISGHDNALDLPFETFVGGHLTRLGIRDDVEIAKEYIGDVRTASFDALASTDFFAVFGDIGFLDPNDPSFLNQWELFETYLGKVTDSATEAVLDKWLGKLGGAEVFTESHCFAMVESIRIDDNAVAG